MAGSRLKSLSVINQARIGTALGLAGHALDGAASDAIDRRIQTGSFTSAPQPERANGTHLGLPMSDAKTELRRGVLTRIQAPPQ